MARDQKQPAMSSGALEKTDDVTTDAVFAFGATAILAIVLFSTPPYLRLTYDSFDYIAASKSVETYLNGQNPDGFYYLIRPPLMPLYLHLFQDKVFGGALLNTLAFGLTVYASRRLARLFISDRSLVTIFSLALVFSYSFLQLHFFLWTEAPFIVIILGLFYCIARDRAIHQVILLLILAFLLRKAAGFITLATVAIYLNERKVRAAVLVSAIMAAVFVGWEVLAMRSIGSLPYGNTWDDHLGFGRLVHLDSLTSWLLPRVLPVTVRILLFIGLFVIVAFTVRPALTDYWAKRRNQTLFLFWFVYCSGIVLWGGRNFDEVDRYLAVILPFFMLTSFSVLSEFARTYKARKRLCLLSTLWLLYPISKSAYHLFTIHTGQ